MVILFEFVTLSKIFQYCMYCVYLSFIAVVADVLALLLSFGAFLGLIFIGCTCRYMLRSVINDDDEDDH